MPRYVYKCNDCGDTFMVRHSVGETVNVCAVCSVEGELVRVPSTVTISYKGRDVDKQLQAGSLTKRSIEEFRSDLKRDKENLRGKDYEE